MLAVVPSPNQFFLAASREGLDGPLSGQGEGPAAALFPMDEHNRASGPRVSASGPFLVLPKPAVQIDCHSGVVGTVAAFQNVQ
jgi:hypothetical protein